MLSASIGIEDHFLSESIFFLHVSRPVSLFSDQISLTSLILHYPFRAILPSPIMNTILHATSHQDHGGLLNRYFLILSKSEAKEKVKATVLIPATAAEKR